MLKMTATLIFEELCYNIVRLKSKESVLCFVIKKLGLLVRVGGRVSCKSRVRSHVVTGSFLGKLQIFVTDLCDKFVMNICDNYL